MNKTLLRKRVLGVIFYLSFFYGSMFLSGALAETTEEVELTSISGTVEVSLDSDTDEYVPAQEGMKLEAGDKIRTKDESSAELSFNEDNTNLVRLDNATEAKIVLKDDEKLEVTEGEVFSSINQLPSGSIFEIRTPTAVSGARGTDWVTKVTDEGTDVEAVDSQPYVRHLETDGTVSKEITPVVAGQMTTVRKFQRPTEFRPMPEARRAQWQEMKQKVHQRGNEAIQKRQERPPFQRQEFLQQARNRGEHSAGGPEGNMQKQMRDGSGKDGRPEGMGQSQGERQSGSGGGPGNRPEGMGPGQGERQPGSSGGPGNRPAGIGQGQGEKRSGSSGGPGNRPGGIGQGQGEKRPGSGGGPGNRPGGGGSQRRSAGPRR